MAVDEERSKEHIENFENHISDFLCKMSTDLDLIKYECRVNNWDDEIISFTEDACLNLGFTLAILKNWYKKD